MKQYPAFPITHGCTDRTDGSFGSRDERQQWFAQHYPHTPYFEVHQKHTGTVLVLDGKVQPSEAYNTTADAIVSKQKNIIMAVKTADCVPVLLYDPAAQVGAVIHSGWKGTLANIVQKTVHAMKQQGASAYHIQAFLGPAINACCYSVSDKRIAAFTEAGLPVHGNSLCLAELVAIQLKREGVDDIIAPITCTSCQSERYFSYRREGPDHGTMISFVCL
ncbi:peptidoglycan editing factor PgeF [Candidatus Roizmanbacteria bacterium CG10_big_fil_rev_8_21_14_0_10_45_7]|uniref:Purine nucleoside phosphorylase n=1 Tax=Candidatus Roizmanbacteria bacterium CG10_big_fil_rev_8_21_14_0_10_45_7 TaxID=1974854 RepID=A0A2M8KUL5_9BACT|nr:MAG: peptidoglycan editing factor PgeF [Candidatus Roizmanbacteria bacterium CG10_big_fil_rev_8_21_14_0_10_45_7]